MFRTITAVGFILLSTSSFGRQDFSGSVCANKIKHIFCPVLHLDYDSPINSEFSIAPSATINELRDNKCIHHMLITGCDITCVTDISVCQ